MLVTNNTIQDYWFGPLHLLGGVGQTLTVDDTSETSLYLLDDAVADAINNLYNSGKIGVSGQAQPFPRPTGVPALLHGDGSPEGLVFAPQGSVYLRRDGTGANSLYTKTTGVTINTGWENYTTTAVGPGTTYRKTTSKAVTNTTTETDLLNGEITLPAGTLGTTGLMRLTAWGDALYNAGGTANSPRFKFKVGSGPTTVIDIGTLANGVGNSANRFGWRIVVEWMNLGATNSQWATIDASVACLSGGASTGSFTTGEGSILQNNAGAANAVFRALGGAVSAIDTTVGLAVILSVINGSATNTEVKLLGALVEII
jgi:hypothetical protein